MTETTMTRFAGLAGMAGGLLFFIYFIALNPLLGIFTPPLEPGAIGAIKMVITVITSLCLAGCPLGLLALGAAGSGWRKKLGIAGSVVSLLGLALYIAGSLFIYSFPDRALKQLITPVGSFLLATGTLLLAAAILSARRLSGWRAMAPLLAGLYFLLQFPLQALLFLSKGQGPNPILLGMWGIFWMLLGYAIRTTRSAGTSSGSQAAPPEAAIYPILQ